MPRPNYGSNIPKARQELMKIAMKLYETDFAAAHAIDDIVERLMTRSSPVKRAPVKNRRLTNWQRSQAIKLLRTTDMHVNEIANAVGTNPGRISELQQGLI